MKNKERTIWAVLRIGLLTKLQAAQRQQMKATSSWWIGGWSGSSQADGKETFVVDRRLF